MTIEVFLCVYLLLINLLTFIAFGIDKFNAAAKQWRITERMLLMASFLGGLPSAWLSVFFFRHKTKDVRFLFFMILISASWLIGIVVFLSLNS
jgi:uncharacterized membrane protein YsdA (DUF1294 family)